MKVNEELISIVVPIYNVELYVTNCITSIISQTYSKIEIILVDDGSTDTSAEICDDISTKDDRVRVIHKVNGGLSDARNMALEIAVGKYIMFVDSDDYIPDYAVEYLYGLLTESKANVAIGRLIMTKELNTNAVLVNDKTYVYNNKEAIGQLLYANLYSTSASAKLYERILFDEVSFPVGKLHEDLYTIYRVIDKATKIIYGDEVVYFYYHRPGSITVSEFSPKRLDALSALKEIEANVSLKDYGIQNAYSSQVIENIFSFFSTDITVDDINKYGLWDLVKKNRINVFFDTKVSSRIKGYALVSLLGLKQAMRITKLYYKKKWK